MDRTAELINKDKLERLERLELLENLYYVKWDELSPETVDKIFIFLRNDEFNEEEISLILSLYHNENNAYIEEFNRIITKIYKDYTIKFFKGLHLNPGEISGLAKLFKNNRVFDFPFLELGRIIESGLLTKDELATARKFYGVYDAFCKTWGI